MSYTSSVSKSVWDLEQKCIRLTGQLDAVHSRLLQPDAIALAASSIFMDLVGIIESHNKSMPIQQTVDMRETFEVPTLTTYDKIDEPSSPSLQTGDQCELHIKNNSPFPTTLQEDGEWGEVYDMRIISSGESVVIHTTIGTTYNIYFHNTLTPGATITPNVTPNGWRNNPIFTAEIDIPLDDIITHNRPVNKVKVVSSRTPEGEVERYHWVDYQIHTPPDKLLVVVTNHTDLHSTLISLYQGVENTLRIAPHSSAEQFINTDATLATYTGPIAPYECDNDYSISRWTLERGKQFFPDAKEGHNKGLVTQNRPYKFDKCVYVDILHKDSRQPTHPESGWGELILNKDNNYGSLIAPYQILHPYTHMQSRPIDRVILID